MSAESGPCAVCGAERFTHSCRVSLVQSFTFAVVVTDTGAYATAVPCAFTRAVRDA